MKFTTHHTYKHNIKISCEIQKNKQSETVPGESYTISELLQRARSNQPMPQSLVEYMEVDDVDNITNHYRNGLDLTDIEDVANKTNMLAKNLTKAVEDAKIKRAENIAREEGRAEALQEAIADKGAEPVKEERSDDAKGK